MTTRVSTDSGPSSGGTVTLSSMSITGSARKCVAAACGTNVPTYTMDSAQLGGVNLLAMAGSEPLSAANCRIYCFYLDEASFPAGSTADCVLDTSEGGALESGAAGIYSGVATGTGATPDEYTHNNNDDYVLAITPTGTGGLAVAFVGRQIQSGDSLTATGDLAIQVVEDTNFQAGLALLDELDPPASSRDGSGDWGANFRDNAAKMFAWEEGVAAAGFNPTLTAKRKTLMLAA